MGFFRTLYREARDILGMKPPPENDLQRAERICDEVKGDMGGRKSRTGDDVTLTTSAEGRGVVIRFDAAGSRALISVASELGDGPRFRLVVDQSESSPPGRHRRSVGSALFIEAPDPAALDTFDALWKALPTGTRGNLAATLQKSNATFQFDGDAFHFTPDVAVLGMPGAKSQIRTQATMLARLVVETERAWQAL
jgi:hypothetical protein